MKKALIMLFFILALPVISYGDTVIADSCSLIDVTAAHTAASNGDTITIPSGSCTWTSSLPVTKEVAFIGGSGGETIITDSTGTTSIDQPFYINGVDNWRISGITFLTTQTDFKGIIHVETSTNWRIDNIDFIDIGGLCIVVNGVSYPSVIDNNNFALSTNDSNAGIQVNGEGASDWTDDITWGGAGFVFIEDNTFNFAYKGDSALQGNLGARVVFRYNDVDGTGIDAHGACSSIRGARAYEIYSNSLNAYQSGADANNPRNISLRGGTHLVYDNIMDNASMAALRVTNYRTCYGVGSPECNIANRTRCDGVSVLDENADATGWACLDQIGRGKDQSSDPMYEWNNTTTGLVDIDVTVGSTGDCTDPAIEDHIQAGRDFFNDTTKPAYTPFTYPHPLRNVPPTPIPITYCPTCPPMVYDAGGFSVTNL